VKTDSTGNKEWDKAFGGAGREFAYSVQQTSDGSYVLAGETGSDFWLVKTDAIGNKQWDKTSAGAKPHVLLSRLPTAATLLRHSGIWHPAD